MLSLIYTSVHLSLSWLNELYSFCLCVGFILFIGTLAKLQIKYENVVLFQFWLFDQYIKREPMFGRA